jgi:UDP-N-acetylglucosamine enolpyruvyl transferase
LDARNEERVAVALLLAGMAAEGTTIVQNSGSVDDYYGPILEIADNLAQKRRVKA